MGASHQFTLEIFGVTTHNGVSVSLANATTNTSVMYTGFVSFWFGNHDISWCNHVGMGWRLRCKDGSTFCDGRKLRLCNGMLIL